MNCPRRHWHWRQRGTPPFPTVRGSRRWSRWGDRNTCAVANTRKFSLGRIQKNKWKGGRNYRPLLAHKSNKFRYDGWISIYDITFSLCTSSWSVTFPFKGLFIRTLGSKLGVGVSLHTSESFVPLQVASWKDNPVTEIILFEEKHILPVKQSSKKGASAAESHPRKRINFRSCVKFQILLICGVFSPLPPCLAVMGNHAKHDLVFHLFVLNGIYEFIAALSCCSCSRLATQMGTWELWRQFRLNRGSGDADSTRLRRSPGKMGKLCFLVFPHLLSFAFQPSYTGDS